MSIFGTIMDKIFHHGDAAAASPAPPASTTQPPGPAGTSSAAPAAPTSQDTASPTQVAAATTASAAAAPAAPRAPVDVAAILDGLAAKNSQHLDWKHSIVDMMKLLDLDSSLAARKSLAGELHFSGDTNDSASMNVWLHKQVMQKLAENGGTVPAELRA